MSDLDEVIAHLGAALMQTIDSDDQIIMNHVREAERFAKKLRGAPRSAVQSDGPNPLSYWQMMYYDLLKRVDAGEFSGAAQASTDGRVTIPLEPTREMWAAGADAAVKKAGYHHGIVVEAVYRAMVGAAPRTQADHPACPCKPAACIYPGCTCALPSADGGTAA